MEHADLDASVEAAEHVCQEVQSLLAKVHSTLERIRDVSVSESTSTTMVSVIEALALKEMVKIRRLPRCADR
jgi:predicted translin family RNA/ssDNA-binding protein